MLYCHAPSGQRIRIMDVCRQSCITDRHTAAAFSADQDAGKEGSPFTGRAASFRVCTVGAKTVLVFLELFPGDISRMMVGEEDFPVTLIWETDRMVFEMSMGINGFVIAVTP